LECGIDEVFPFASTIITYRPVADLFENQALRDTHEYKNTSKEPLEKMMNEQKVCDIVYGIMSNLTGRKGFSMDDIDEDIQEEIFEELKEIVRNSQDSA